MSSESVTGDEMARIEKEVFDLYRAGKKVTSETGGKILNWGRKVA
jgi:hypothetical protein